MLKQRSLKTLKSLKSVSKRSLSSVLAAASLFCLFGSPALAQSDSPAPAGQVSCATLDECMQKGRDAQDIDTALDYFSLGIDSWREGDPTEGLTLATAIRGQIYLHYFGEVQDTRLLDLAERDFISVTRLSPTSYEGFAGLAMVAANRGKFDETEAWFQKGFAADPRNPYAYQERAAYYYLRENFTGVVNDLTTALALVGQGNDTAQSLVSDPDDADLLSDEQRGLMLLLRAHAYAELGKESEALADFSEACRLGETRACQ